MEYIKVGVIANTHGLKGDLRIKSDSDFNRFAKGSVVYINYKGEYLKMISKSHRVNKGLDLVVFEGYEDINKVECFKGSEVYINKDDRHELDEDEFYYDELIGLDVYYNDELIGKVTNIIDVPQGEILSIERKDDKDVLIPFENKFIEEMDDIRIIAKNLEGLI